MRSASVDPRDSPVRLGMSLKPLAPTTFLVRNLGKTGPLIAVILLAVLLIAGIVAMINSIPFSIRTIYSYTQHYAGITARGDPAQVPEIKRIVETESPAPLERIIVCRASGATVRSLVGKWPFVVFGLTRPDMEFLLERLGSKGVQGRLPRPNEPEAVVSAPVARNLGLRIGSVLLRPSEPQSYSPIPVRVVGIAQTDEWLMLNDIGYQRLNHFPNIDNLLVFAKDPAQQREFDRWVFERLRGERAQVFVHFRLEEETADMFSILYRILDVVIGTLVLVITVMMAMLMSIYQGQRLVEFGLLQAIGYTRRELLVRVFRETALVLTGGWLIGVGAAYVLLLIVKATLMDPNAFSLDPLDIAAYLYTIPVPISVLAAATITVMLRFRRFDPVAVIERRLV
jgi:ABC-type lipoprotein release transport system permease subunit